MFYEFQMFLCRTFHSPTGNRKCELASLEGRAILATVMACWEASADSMFCEPRSQMKRRRFNEASFRRSTVNDAATRSRISDGHILPSNGCWLNVTGCFGDKALATRCTGSVRITKSSVSRCTKTTESPSKHRTLSSWKKKARLKWQVTRTE